jgi:hypothetical protein
MQVSCRHFTKGLPTFVDFSRFWKDVSTDNKYILERRTGTLVKSFQIFYTGSKSLSEPVAWLKTILLQAVLWQFAWFPFPDARG